MKTRFLIWNSTKDGYSIFFNLIALSQRIVNQDKYKDCRKAAAAQFFCAVACNKSSENVIHS